jgi:hypothetical protein
MSSPLKREVLVKKIIFDEMEDLLSLSQQVEMIINKSIYTCETEVFIGSPHVLIIKMYKDDFKQSN